jgi:cell division protein FtsI/penicillin-binding protein 2
LVGSLLVVGGRLVWFQAIESPAYAQLAVSQRLRDWEIPARRGSLYDRDGEPLAITVEGRTIYAVPPAVVDREGAARALASVLGGDESEYLDKLDADAGFVFLARKVDVEKAEALERLDLAGIHTTADYTRSYPGGDLASQVLGFVGVDDVGLAGLEKHYDELLAGTPGRVIAERDPFGRIIPGGSVEETEPVDGASLVLTIDREIQYEAQRALAKAVEDAAAESGTVVVLDPDDGSILAMAAYPTFDPNRYQEEPSEAFRNRAVTDLYEPGSTMKSFTAAASIEGGFREPDDVLHLAPTIELGGRTIHESHPRGTVDWTVEEIVAHSSNVGAVELGLEMGDKHLYRSFVDFGFSERTGVDFPGEERGRLPAPEEWSASTIGNIPFGQGHSVTPLQLARAMAAIANGGLLPTPHLLESAPGRPDIETSWPTERAVSEETAAKMRGILRAVVDDGTGTQAAVPGYTAAGKTGTAQKARTDGRGYAEGLYVASFAGFVPAEDPAVVIVVTVDEPHNGIYGGAIAGPAFSRLGEFCMAHLAVKPAAEGEAAGQGGE